MKNEEIEIMHSKAHMASYGLGATINQFLNIAFVSLGFYFYEVEVGLNVWMTSLGYIQIHEKMGKKVSLDDHWRYSLDS